MTLPPWYIPDDDGVDLRPDPDVVTSVPEFLKAMRRYLVWAGNPSFRTLAQRCRHRVSESTFYAALNGSALPRFPVVHDFIGACGATDEYWERFELAWRRLANR